MLSNGPEDARQGADAEGRVVRNANALVAGLMGLKDQVTAGLMNQQVLVIFTEMGGQCLAREFAGELQTPDNTSSRTKWRRILLLAFSG